MKITKRDKTGYITLDTEKLGRKLTNAIEGFSKDVYKRKDKKKADKKQLKSISVVLGVMITLFLISLLLIRIVNIETLVGSIGLVITLIICSCFLFNVSYDDFKKTISLIEVKLSPKTIKKCSKEFIVIENNISDIDKDAYVAIIYKGEKIYVHKNKFVSPIIENEKYIAFGREDNYVIKSTIPLEKEADKNIYTDLTDKEIEELKTKEKQLIKKLKRYKRPKTLRITLRIVYITYALTVFLNAYLLENIRLGKAAAILNLILLSILILVSPIVSLVCSMDNRERSKKEQLEIVKLIIKNPKIASKINGEVVALTTITDKKKETVLVSIKDKNNNNIYELTMDDIYDNEFKYKDKVNLYFLRGNDKYIALK